MSKRLAALVVLSLAISSASFAAPWLPLTPGMRWEYRSAAGGHQVETITGFANVRGRAVAVRSYAEGADAGLQNYWFIDPDGSVMLAGFLNPSAGLAWAYEPPVRYLPVPPVVGPQPFQTVTVHDLFTDAVQFLMQVRFEVLELTNLAVPAGSFACAGVGQVVPLPGPASAAKLAVTLDGRTLGSTAPGIYATFPTDWFSEGVGVVQYQTSDLFQLVGFGSPTPVAQSSWARVKRLYR